MSDEREGLRDLFHRARSDEALGQPWEVDTFIDRILALLREGGEPVAWIDKHGLERLRSSSGEEHGATVWPSESMTDNTALYTHPPVEPADEWTGVICMWCHKLEQDLPCEAAPHGHHTFVDGDMFVEPEPDARYVVVTPNNTVLTGLTMVLADARSLCDHYVNVKYWTRSQLRILPVGRARSEEERDDG